MFTYVSLHTLHKHFSWWRYFILHSTVISHKIGQNGKLMFSSSHRIICTGGCLCSYLQKNNNICLSRWTKAQACESWKLVSSKTNSFLSQISTDSLTFSASNSIIEQEMWVLGMLDFCPASKPPVLTSILSVEKSYLHPKLCQC